MTTSMDLKDTAVWPRWKGILFFSGIAVLLIAWFGLGFYLHQQVVEARARVEQKRIEQNRREEFLRRGAQYQQELKERTKKPQSRNALDNL